VHPTGRRASWRSRSACSAAPDELAAAISAAANDGTLLTLTDDKGRQILVPGDRIAYVEIGVVEGRRVGFGAI
jgi:hypothetical protein